MDPSQPPHQPPEYTMPEKQQYNEQVNIGFQQPIPDPVVVTQPQLVQQSVFVGAPNVGPDPCGVTCPSCRHQIVTRVEFEPSSKTHIAALILCCCICWPCAWIPYVMDSCQNANHYCPNCNSFIGTYEN